MDLKLNNLSEFALTNRYIPVEYVQTSGYPNINTGVACSYATRNVKVDLVIDVVSNSDAGSIIFDATNGSRHTYLKCVNANDNTSFVTKYYQQNTQTETSIQFSGKTHIIESVNYLKVDNTEYTLTNTSASVTATLYLFKSGSTVTKVHAFKVYQSNTLIRDYIPVISCQEGHLGEACLYDKVNGVFYYSAPTGSFTASTNICDRITTAFVKDCPNVSGIDLLRIAVNLQRVRCNIGNVSGTLEELQYYATLSGYSDNYEEQIKPRIIGTFTVNSYHTNAELSALDGLIDGLTIISDNNYNINYLLSQGELAIQTFDEDADNYNPAVAIKLNTINVGYVHTNPITPNGGRYLLRKTEAANCGFGSNTFFNNVTTLTDSNGIISDDNTQTYDFESFDEFKYFTKYTSVPGGVTNQNSMFGRCSKLQSIVLPSTVTSIGNYGFANCTALNTITIPASCTSFGANCFTVTNSIASVYYEGTFENWINIAFNNSDSTPCKNAGQLYIQNVPLTSISIPENTATIKGYTFYSMPYITGQIIIPDSVTAIGTLAFNGLSNITLLHIPVTTTSNKINNSGKEGSTLIVDGDYTTERSYDNIKFSNIIISGNFETGSNRGFTNSLNFHTLRINGNYKSTGGSNLLTNAASGAIIKFIEINGSVTGALFYLSIMGSTSQTVYHFGSSQIALTTTQFASYSTGTNDNVIARASKFLVGDGTSRANDEAVLALYLADTAWSTQSAKLGTWYDYNGEYKWYYITDNLTNCTNTNPDAWPHITRGESYETTIVPDEGMTIDSLTVEMLDTDTTSPTYDTYIPQPTSYDSATGIYTISIPSVTGNIVITASAS